MQKKFFFILIATFSDFLIGDNFLRSVYSLYDFGDFDSNNNMGNPYVKLLSITNPDTASAEFVAARGGTARTGITYNVSGAAAASSNVSAGGISTDQLNKLVDYIPAMLAIMALNAVALLCVAGAVIAYMCYRRRRRSSKKERAHALNNRAPTPFPGLALGGPATDTMGDPNHRYSRVETGEPEDQPFTPPAPAFHGEGGDSLGALGPRVRSTYSGMSIPRDYRISAAGSDVTAFVPMPPSPGFKKDMNDRPKSIA